MKRILIIVALLGAFSCWQCSKADDASAPTTNVVADGDVPLSEDVTPTAAPDAASATAAPDAASATD